MKRFKVWFLSFAFVCINLSVLYSAEIFSLNGIWKYNKGFRDEWKNPAINDSNWKKMKVPSNWAIENKEMFDYGGTVFYRYKFRIPKDTAAKMQRKGSVVRLEFKGADYFTTAWLNGKQLGSRHEGYFQPFFYEVTDNLKYDGENLLAVKVESPWDSKDYGDKRLIKGIFIHHDCRPREFSGNTGGIWNDVNLVHTGQVTIERVLIKTSHPGISGQDKPAEVNFKYEFFNHSDNVHNVNIAAEFEGLNFESKKYRKDKNLRLPPGRTAFILSETVSDPKVWWTWDRGKPNLYRAKTTIKIGQNVSDSSEDTFGIRTVRLDPGTRHFYLNGKKLFQRGSNYIATQWLSNYNKEKYKKDVKMMKDANLNSIRVHAHILPREFYDICDMEGILVWADFPLIWGYNNSEAFEKQAMKQYEEFILGYYNHPSIWIWCAHNEGGEDRSLNAKLDSLARRLDTTRATTENSGDWDKHIYSGWYVGNYFEILGNRPKFVTEYGAQAVPLSVKEFIDQDKLWPIDTDKWAYHDLQLGLMQKFIGHPSIYFGAEDFAAASQKYQYDLVKYCTEHFRRIKYTPLGGIYHFMFTEPWPSITWAVIDNKGEPKLGYYALKETMAPILVSIEWKKNEYESGGNVSLPVWIINDNAENYQNCLLEWKIKNRNTEKIAKQKSKKINVPADSSQKADLIDFTIPSNTRKGIKYLVEVYLKDSHGKILSKNRFPFHIGKEDAGVTGVSKGLEGTWLFYRGDNTLWKNPEFNDSSWKRVNVPAHWESQGFSGYDGFGWYRISFKIPESWKGQDIAFCAGAIDDADETYLNGHLIGRMGKFAPEKQSAWDQPRLYILKQEYINYGKDNVIAVRVSDWSGQGGIWKGPVKVGSIKSMFSGQKYEGVYINYK